MSQGSSIRGVDGSAASSTSTPVVRLCTVCTEPIPFKRLQAVPNASVCVGCLTNAGDVPLLKRFDEYTPAGDRIETLFTQNSRIEQQMAHLNNDVAGVAAFETAAGETTEVDPRETEQIIQAATADEELDDINPPLDMEEDEFESLIDEIYYDEADELDWGDLQRHFGTEPLGNDPIAAPWMVSTQYLAATA